MMTSEQMALRQAIVDTRPDPADPDSWPDIANLPGRLLPILSLLDADIDVAHTRGWSTDRLVMYRDVVREAREALISLFGVSPLEAWKILHPPHLDPLDGIYDCGSCGVGKADAEHRRRWRLP